MRLPLEEPEVAGVTTQVSPEGCADSCEGAEPIEARNRTCYCLSLDEAALHRGLEADLRTRDMSSAMLTTHPYLFSAVPMFVSREHVEGMERVIRAVEAVVASSPFQSAALAWAPAIAHYDPGSPGGLLAYDFHLGDSVPQLIEINTNPGGALLNAVLGRAQRPCCTDATGLAMAPMGADNVEGALVEVFMTEWRLQRKDVPLRSLAIVDEAPEQQYLYPEFLLYRNLFSRHGVDVVICDPRDLSRKDGRLWHGDRPIDYVYNRLTDFSFEQPAQGALRLAYLAHEVVVSPHPRSHALYADKRNLTLLCQEAFLRGTGVADDVKSTLLSAIPHTEIMTAGNRDEFWTKRRRHFFKPAAGYGSKGTYRGDKLTKRVWEEMAQGTYVAQALVAPSERHVAGTPVARTLKADIRNYAYNGVVKLIAARLYQGQVTNFRTPGGGFAPVLTEKR